MRAGSVEVESILEEVTNHFYEERIIASSSAFSYGIGVLLQAFQCRNINMSCEITNLHASFRRNNVSRYLWGDGLLTYN
jgi:hypothetical protein